MGSALPDRSVESPSREAPLDSERRDAELLRRGQAAFRVAVVDRPALSVGVGLRDAKDCLTRAADQGYTIVHRSTGGTAVLLEEGDLTWAVVLPRGDPRVGPSLTGAYASLGAPLVHYLQGRGVPAAWTSVPVRSHPCCLLSGRGRALTTQRGILSGAAQHLTRDAILHHGTLPRQVDRAAHRTIFDHDDPAIFDQLVGWTDLDVRESPETVRDALAQRFERFLGTA